MNSMQLKSKLKNLSIEKNVDFNTLLRLYMYDRFIKRLSISDYRDNFILKGGFYLSTLFGVETRNTMDIDISFCNADFNEETIVKMINEIVSVDLEDSAKLSYISISHIRDEDEYGGYMVELLVELENIKEKFHLDIATGDPITPGAIFYKYKPVLADKLIKVWAYNIETVLAEKLETILSRLELNGRMRDFYDIYLIYIREWDNLDKDSFRKAVEKTFYKREFKGDIIENYKLVKESTILRKRWSIYSNKYSYAKDIEYDEILKYIAKFIDVLEVVAV
ncbi:MAG: nucleotidyl transferase AbiEii/AbiGii toxin family protein [Firmicutes bacterium]|nr:nucleotidyl transferase AbiEii/AbiGii toxin family protein [Bacillota bacterium]